MLKKSTHKQPPLLVIVGETASGKTSLAIEIAKNLNGEIVSADSWTVRRGLDIGTAKPNAEQRKEIEHHLIDIVDPLEDFNAAEYKKKANKVINEIYSKGKLPIMVGGTGLYVDSVIYDFEFLPVDPNFDRKEHDLKSLEELMQIIKEKKLDYSSVDTRNKRRLVRLIETNGEIPKRKELRDNTLLIGIKVPKDKLRERISLRVDQMLEDGLEDEVRNLAKQYSWDDEIMKGVGYRQWKSYFEGTQNLEETKRQIINATMSLAKRQRTWFNRNNSIQWIDSSIKMDAVVELITTKLNI